MSRIKPGLIDPHIQDYIDKNSLRLNQYQIKIIEHTMQFG